MWVFFVFPRRPQRARGAGPCLPSHGRDLAGPVIKTHPSNANLAFHSTSAKENYPFVCTYSCTFFGWGGGGICPLKGLKFTAFPVKGSSCLCSRFCVCGKKVVISWELWNWKFQFLIEKMRTWCASPLPLADRNNIGTFTQNQHLRWEVGSFSFFIFEKTKTNTKQSSKKPRNDSYLNMYSTALATPQILRYLSFHILWGKKKKKEEKKSLSSSHSLKTHLLYAYFTNQLHVFIKQQTQGKNSLIFSKAAFVPKSFT